MSELIGSDRQLPESAHAILEALAGTLIPASAPHGAPGADDPAILADLERSAAVQAEAVTQYLGRLDELARSEFGAPFCTLDEKTRLATAVRFRDDCREGAGLLISLLAQCYYRDDRVLASLGEPARPPYPEGYDIQQGDWSLLDSVRARGRIYREVD